MEYGIGRMIGAISVFGNGELFPRRIRADELYSVLGLPWSFGGTKWTRGVVSRGV